LREVEPALRREVLGGVFYSDAATLNPYRFVVEMAKRASCRGVEIRARSGVAEILVRDGQAWGARTTDGETIEADRIVVAAGAYSARLLNGLGASLPLQAAKGYHHDCENGVHSLLRHACVLGESMVFCTPMDGHVRFAGTLEFSGIHHEIRRPRLEQLTRSASRYFHTMDDAVFGEEWCGLRPCLPDGLPAIGPLRACEGVFIATGHAMMGLTLGPVTGKLIAEWIVDGHPGMDLAMLAAERFRGDETSRHR
jgi:D-amino-acid dehydrogenase